MPKIITEKIERYKLAPRVASDPPGSFRISYLSHTDIAGETFQTVKELMFPSYAWAQFLRDKRVHYIQTNSKPPQQIRIGVGSSLLRPEDIPKMTKYGRFRLRLWWTRQRLLGNV